MVNLITGPRGSGKTQQMIDLANEKVKTSNGNVVFIKKSHKDTYTVDFNIRAIRMADYPDILTLEEFVGFLYGMVAGNHDIETIFIDSVLKQANITLESLPVFLQKFVHGLPGQRDWQLHAHVSKIALETGIAGDVVQAEIPHGGRG